MSLGARYCELPLNSIPPLQTSRSCRYSLMFTPMLGPSMPFTEPSRPVTLIPGSLGQPLLCSFAGSQSTFGWGHLQYPVTSLTWQTSAPLLDCSRYPATCHSSTTSWPRRGNSPSSGKAWPCSLVSWISSSATTLQPPTCCLLNESYSPRILSQFLSDSQEEAPPPQSDLTATQKEFLQFQDINLRSLVTQNLTTIGQFSRLHPNCPSVMLLQLQLSSYPAFGNATWMPTSVELAPFKAHNLGPYPEACTIQPPLADFRQPFQVVPVQLLLATTKR